MFVIRLYIQGASEIGSQILVSYSTLPKSQKKSYNINMGQGILPSREIQSVW